MNEIILKKNQKKKIEDKFYIIEKGKILTKDIFLNDRYVSNESYLKTGDIVGNILNFYNLTDEKNINDTELEIKALEDTYLKEINFTLNDVDFVENIIYQLTKKVENRLLFHKYKKEEYVLSSMLSYSNNEGIINKNDITFEDFNLSRSQFYLILSKLKESKFFYIKDENYILNIEKIYDHLEKQ